MRDRHRDPPAEAQDPGQRDRARRRDVDRPADRAADRRLERTGGVVGVEELKPRVEAELHRDHRQGEVADQRAVEVGGDLGLEAKHAPDELGVAAGEVVEVLLELGDVALKARPQRRLAGEVLGVEGRRRTLAAVDRRRTAHDDPAQALGPLAGGEQLQRADHVDLVQRPRRPAGLGVPEDPAVHDRVDPGCREQAREQRAADVGLDEVGAPEVVGRGARVDAGDVLDRGVALEPAGELGAPMTRDPGDRDPPARLGRGHI